MSRVYPEGAPLVRLHTGVERLPVGESSRALSGAVATATHARRIARTLVHNGVNNVVISPGSRSTPLVLAFAEAAEGGDVTLHTVLDERAAGFLALGIARGSGSPVVLLCTSGSAGSHYLPAVIEASMSRVPLIVLTADRPPELRQVGAPQTIEQRGLFGSHVRWSAEVGPPIEGQTAPWAGALAAQAIASALASPPGPVHLNVPYRKPLWSPEAAPTDVPVTTVYAGQRLASPDPGVVARLAAQCDRPGAVVCGPYAGLDAAAAHGLGAALGWPVIAEPASDLRYGGSETNTFVAHADALLRAPEVAALLNAEVVLRFGHTPTSSAVNDWLAGRETILVDPDGWWHDPSAQATSLVVAEPNAMAHSLACALTVPSDAPFRRRSTFAARCPEWIARWRTVDCAASVALRPHLDGEWEGAIAHTLVSSIGTEAEAEAEVALHLASSMPIRDVDSFGGTTPSALRVFTSRGANGIDGMVATAAGEAFGSRLPTVLLTGDLAFQHDLAGVCAAVSMDTPLTVVVVDNAGGGIFGFLPIAAHEQAFEPYFVTPQAVDAVAMAAAAGARVIELERTAQLPAALATELTRPGLGVIRIKVDRQHNLIRHRQAFAAVRDAARLALQGLEAARK